MNYQKLDASLISAMEESEAPAESKLSVFVRISHAVKTEELTTLEEMIGSGYASGQSCNHCGFDPFADQCFVGIFIGHLDSPGETVADDAVT